MSGVVPHGRWAWDRGLFPDDEQQQRLQLVQAAMAEAGLDALVVYGNNLEHGDLVYLTQYSPIEAFALALVPAQGEVTLLSNMNLPPGRASIGASRRPPAGSLSELLGEGGKIGLVGFA